MIGVTADGDHPAHSDVTVLQSFLHYSIPILLRIMSNNNVKPKIDIMILNSVKKNYRLSS